mmetsp:Transcript_35654/g.84490  ORF Transcript_35654/g.84490 Transcript_35654/m.84490 type:complete len:327 (-) Transcript_35654:960-1940(-)
MTVTCAGEKGMFADGEVLTVAIVPPTGSRALRRIMGKNSLTSAFSVCLNFRTRVSRMEQESRCACGTGLAEFLRRERHRCCLTAEMNRSLLAKTGPLFSSRILMSSSESNFPRMAIASIPGLESDVLLESLQRERKTRNASRSRTALLGPLCCSAFAARLQWLCSLLAEPTLIDDVNFDALAPSCGVLQWVSEGLRGCCSGVAGGAGGWGEAWPWLEPPSWLSAISSPSIPPRSLANAASSPSRSASGFGGAVKSSTTRLRKVWTTEATDAVSDDMEGPSPRMSETMMGCMGTTTLFASMRWKTMLTICVREAFAVAWLTSLRLVR